MALVGGKKSFALSKGRFSRKSIHLAIVSRVIDGFKVKFVSLIEVYRSFQRF
jgi:hypothetical protein